MIISNQIIIRISNLNVTFAEIDEQLNGIIEKYNELEKMLKEFFKNHGKLVNRAVMAHVISALPVFFNNANEIKSYVYSSISGCSDVAEKMACEEIFSTMMEEDGFNVVS